MNGYQALVVDRRMHDLRAAAEQHRLARTAARGSRSSSLGSILGRFGTRSTRPAPAATAPGI